MGKLKNRLRAKGEGRSFAPGVMIALALCFMLFIFAPLEIYLNNQTDFWYDFFFIIPWYLLFFAIAFAGSMLVLGVMWLIGDWAYDLGLAAYLVVLAGCYYQGNFQTKTLPALDGTEIDMARHARDIRLSSIVWVCIFGGTVLFYILLRREKFRRVVKGVGIFVFLMLLLTIGTLFFTMKGYRRADYLTCVKDGLFEMSTDQNFVIFMLDAVDAGTVETVAKSHPEYEETLRDFTYYSNMMSGYPCTDCAVPLALTGVWYENKELYQNYIDTVFSESTFFAELEQEGYELSFYDTEIRLPESLIGGRFKNMVHSDISFTDPVLFSKRQLKLIGFKYAPWVLKPYCWFNAHKLWNHRSIGAQGEVFFWEDDLFYEDMNRYPVTFTEPRQFKMIHLEGAHSPFVYDAQLNVVENADYYSCVEASMTVLMTYLEKLREAGTYDNSVIIVMADHGLGENRQMDFYGRQHPILFVKGIKEEHSFQVNDAPVAQEDLVGAYSKLIQGNDSMQIFDWKEGDVRERRYLYYNWFYMSHMVEYTTTGHARDTDALQTTGRVFDNKN